MTEPAAPSGASIARPSLVHHPDFVKLWVAESVSQLGTQVTQLAIPFAAIAILNASTFEVAILQVIDFLPFLLVGLVAGVWVDRLRRRPILIVGDLGRAVLLLSVPAAYAANVLTIAQLYVVGFAVGVLTVFFDVAYQSYLPSLVERDQLVEGNGKLEMTRAAAQVVGPGAAGLLIEWLRAPFAIVLDALSYVWSAAFVFAIRKPEPAPEHPVDEHGQRMGMRREMAEGLRYVLGHPILRTVAAATATANLFGNVGGAVTLVFVVRELGMTAQSVGLGFSIGSVGALVGAVTASRIAGRIGVGRTIVGAVGLSGPPLMLISFVGADAPAWVPLAAVALIGLFGGFGAVVYNVNQVSLRQAITPTRLQGRMNASMRWFVWGTIPIGGLLGGILGTWIGLRPTMLIGGIGETLAFVPLLFGPILSVRTMPTAVEGGEAAEPGHGATERGDAAAEPGDGAALTVSAIDAAPALDPPDAGDADPGATLHPG